MLYLCGDVCLKKSKPCHATGACYPGDNLHVCGDTCLEKWQPCNESCSHDGGLHLCGTICTEAPCSSCYVVNGQNIGKPCIFPFIFDSQAYVSCKNSSQYPGKKWCATQVDSAGDGKDFGYCNEDCAPTVTQPDLCKQNPKLYLCGDVCLEKWQPCNGNCSHNASLNLCDDICTEAPCSSCFAVDGPDTGSPCIFPFIFDGVTHEECAWDPPHRCATEVQFHKVLNN